MIECRRDVWPQVVHTLPGKLGIGYGMMLLRRAYRVASFNRY
jgi:hypothetical protein